MKRTSIAQETGLFLLIFAAALFVRFLNLGREPLSNYEASWAIQSWSAMVGRDVTVGANPAYFGLTSMVFYLFGSSNFLARFWPALAGSLVVLVPFGFRQFLGREVAMILAIGLALDPGMVAVSRLAGGPMMAMGFAGVFILFLRYRKPVVAGVFGGLALVSGPSIFLGLIAFLVAYWAANKLGFFPGPEQFSGNGETKKSKNSQDIRPAALSMVITGLLTSTLFVRFPNGLGGIGSSLADFTTGWITTPIVPVLQPILAVVFYQPLAVLFALVAIWRGWMSGSRKVRWLSTWLLTALVIIVVYAQRNVHDAIWVLIPLWTLAAFELSRYFRKPDMPMAASGQAGLLMVLGMIFWLVSISPGLGELTWLVLAVVPLLAVLTTVFIGLGWSWDSARKGAAWGACLILGIYTLSATFGVSQLRQNNPEELWYPPSGIEQADLIQKTLHDLSLIESGRKDWMQITSVVDSSSMRWLLRAFKDVQYVSILDQGSLPEVIITAEGGADLSQTMSYRGQDFLWNSQPGWRGPLPQPLWPWVTTRDAPINFDAVVLWARSDLFPEEPEQPDEATDPDVQENETQLDDGSPD